MCTTCQCMHSHYASNLNFPADLCPKARGVYDQIITLPCFPRMSNKDVCDVVRAVYKVSEAFAVESEAIGAAAARTKSNMHANAGSGETKQ